MPICFVNIIILYENGFDLLDKLDDKTQKAFYEMREAEVMGMMELQFVLSYGAYVSKEDTDNMTPFELNSWFELLKKQRKLEDQAQENNNRK